MSAFDVRGWARKALRDWRLDLRTPNFNAGEGFCAHEPCIQLQAWDGLYAEALLSL